MTTESDLINTPQSGLNHIDALVADLPDWQFLTPGRNELFYTFSTASGTQDGRTPTAFNAQQQAAAIAILAHVASLTGIVFTETSDGLAADWHFSNDDVEGSGVAGICSIAAQYSSTQSGEVVAYSADAWIYLDDAEFNSTNVSPIAGNSGYEILLHEIGHALGLKHPFEDSPTLTSGDNTSNTVMSYTHQGGPYSTFRQYDVAALNFLYGKDGLRGDWGVGTSGEYLTGTSASDTITVGTAFSSHTLEGGAGNDTLIYGGNSASFTITREGDWLRVVGGTWNDRVARDVEALQFTNVTLQTSAFFASVYLWSTLTNGQVINPFAEGSDVLRFDDVSISAAQVAVSSGSIVLTHAGKTVTLTGPSLSSATTTNIVFDNGSQLVVGDNTTGTASDDAANTLAGGNGNDRLMGLGGNDTLMGGAGFDVLDGGTGTDAANFSGFGAAVSVDLSYTGAPGEAWTRDTTNLTTTGTWRSIADLVGVENVAGTVYDDDLRGDAANNRLEGAAGNDTLIGGAGFDTLDGGAGIDTADFSGFGAAVSVDLSYTGAPGEAWTRDTTNITTTGAWRAIADLAGIEGLVGSPYDDDLRGDAADNTLFYTAGFDRLEGHGGTDTASFLRFASAVSVDLSYTGAPGEAWTRDTTNITTTGTFRAIADLSGIESLVGTAYDDDLRGTAVDNRLDGGSGNDTLIGGAGFDTLDGGDGTDTADFSSFASAVSVDLSYTGAPGEAWTRDTTNVTTTGTWRPIADLAGIENVVGSVYDDDLRGNAANNSLQGGAGNDTLMGGAGFDTLDGGGNSDTADFSTFGAAVSVDLSYMGAPGEAWTRDTTNITTTGTWRSIADLAGIENLAGTGYDDDLRGDAAANTLIYTGGFDRLEGGDGIDAADFSRFGSAVSVDLSYTGAPGEAWTRDTTNITTTGAFRPIGDLVGIENLTGTVHDDDLRGDNNANRFEGRAGADHLIGGGGSDRFVYTGMGNGIDTIADFAAGNGGDVLDLQTVLEGYVQGTSNLSTFLQLSESAGNTTLRVNHDGAGADFVDLVTLLGSTGLSLNDMVAQGNLIV